MKRIIAILAVIFALQTYTVCAEDIVAKPTNEALKKIISDFDQYAAKAMIERNSIRNIKPVTSFRSKFAYVNNLWLVSAQIIEKYNQKSWEETLKTRIFDPLKMANSSSDMQSFLDAKDVSSLHDDSGGTVTLLPKNWDYLDWSYIAGPAGSINSNIPDMAKWLEFQMNNGKIEDKQLVSEENMKMLHTPKTVISMESDPHKNLFYCMGWIYHEHSPYPIIWHDGGTTMWFSCRGIKIFL